MADTSFIITNLPNDSYFQLSLYHNNRMISNNTTLLAGETYTVVVIDNSSELKYKISEKDIIPSVNATTSSPYVISDMIFEISDNNTNINEIKDIEPNNRRIENVENLFKIISTIENNNENIIIPYNNNRFVVNNTQFMYRNLYIKNDDGDYIIYVQGYSDRMFTVIGKVILDENNVFSNTIRITNDKSINNRIEYVDLKNIFKSIIITKVNGGKIYFIGVNGEMTMGFYTISTNLDVNSIETIKDGIERDVTSTDNRATVRHLFDKVLNTKNRNDSIGDINRYTGMIIYVDNNKVFITCGRDGKYDINSYVDYFFIIDLDLNILKFAKLPISLRLPPEQITFVSSDNTKIIGLDPIVERTDRYVLFDISNLNNIKYRKISASKYGNMLQIETLGFINNNIAICYISSMVTIGGERSRFRRIVIVDKDDNIIKKKYKCILYNSLRAPEYGDNGTKYFGILYSPYRCPELIYITDELMEKIDTVGYNMTLNKSPQYETDHYTLYFNKKFIVMENLIVMRTPFDERYLEYKIQSRTLTNTGSENNSNILNDKLDIYIINNNNKIKYPLQGLCPANKLLCISVNIPGYEKLYEEVEMASYYDNNINGNLDSYGYYEYDYYSINKTIKIKEDIIPDKNEKMAKFKF